MQSLRIVGLLVDMNNLMWAIRYRVFHNLSEEEIINYTLPIGYRVRDLDIRAIAAGADIPQVVTRIYPNMTRIPELFQDPRNRLSEFELDLQRQVADQCRSAFVGYPFHIGLPLAYLLLCELEIQDLTTLIEAKSVHKQTIEFHSYLLVGCQPG
jgi:vacuolar-type H+-ATPase subunit C/Vma6